MKKLACILLAMTLALSVIPVAAAESADDTDPAQETVTVTEEIADDEPIAPIGDDPIDVPADDPTDAPTEAPSDPPAPADPAVTKVTPTAKGLRISWSAYPGAAQHRVFYRVEGGDWKRLGTTSSATIDHNDLTGNTVYYYTVRAMDTAGSYISGYDKLGFSYRYLTTPVLSAIENTNNGQRLTWKASKGAKGYRVYLSVSGSWTEIGSTSQTSYLNPNVTSGKAYTYTVRCYDPDTGAGASYYNRKGLNATYVAAPQIDSFAPISGGTRINWKKSAGAAKYRVFLKNNGSWKKLIDTTGVYADHKNLTAGVTYTYTVRALDKNGKYVSGYNTAGSQRTYLAPPKITAVTPVEDGLMLSWNETDAADSFRIYRKAFLSSWVCLGSTAQTSFIDDSGEEDVLYTYTLRLIDEQGALLTHFTDTGVYYHSNGELAEGKYTVDGFRIPFKSGKVVSGYLKKDGKQYYINASGQFMKNGIVGSKTDGYTYADKNGVCCTSKEIRLAATFMMQNCSGSTLNAKQKSGFMYLPNHYPYKRIIGTPTKASDITSRAVYMFTNKCGNCFCYAACYACLAKIAGYRARVVIGTTDGSPHGWVEVLVNGKWLICDPNAQLPGYHMPAYTYYMVKKHRWQITAKKRFELTIDSSGKAIWKPV